MTSGSSSVKECRRELAAVDKEELNLHVNCGKNEAILFPAKLKKIGGILLYIKDTSWENFYILNEANSEDGVWINMMAQTPCNLRGNIYACFCYMPPVDSTAALHEGSQWNSLEVEVLKYSM